MKSAKRGMGAGSRVYIRDSGSALIYSREGRVDMALMISFVRDRVEIGFLCLCQGCPLPEINKSMDRDTAYIHSSHLVGADSVAWSGLISRSLAWNYSEQDPSRLPVTS